MSTKPLFLTHEAADMGKKLNYLPMMSETCHQNSRFGCTFIPSCTRNSGFVDTLENNGQWIVESGK
jgi:hypothetical protein